MAVTEDGNEVLRLAAELRAANEQLVEVELTNRRLRTQLRSARGSEERLQKELRGIRKSFSWRITYPVRVFQRRVRRRNF